MVTTSGLESTASSLENWTRAGYVARGLIYILLGYVALSAEAPRSTTDLFQTVEDLPAGQVLLAIIMVGAFGYGLWKLFDAAKNLEGFDDDATGKTKRVFYVIGGLGYWILALLAARTLFSSTPSAGGGTEKAAAMAPDWLLYVAGAGIIVAGLYQFKKGLTREFLEGLSANAPSFVGWFGLLGHVARAIVFVTSGWFVLQAVGDSDEAKGLAAALTSLKDTGTLFTLLCIGLILFGIFSLVEARYRIIPNEDLRPNR
ncbi:DUF1206 domain-containing protein [Sphingomicrobium astaxanthinifaciens]|uniref:DUF1206 domain-containing protein n=1 Tax=Sphingomicrobium astaxanthinifaciens TaxID=1227949 RepID=UPI001FCB40D1|nr:DUF1206 domain-containing protein [Sphingomicrobium astaxanthinifaciens]MCJ7420986.1 DUF1206 domain-containing protein [Sphingomicrobium astaxanthinifaciens]